MIALKFRDVQIVDAEKDSKLQLRVLFAGHHLNWEQSWASQSTAGDLGKVGLNCIDEVYSFCSVAKTFGALSK